jgi:hypothetical protein
MPKNQCIFATTKCNIIFVLQVKITDRLQCQNNIKVEKAYLKKTYDI